MLGRRNRGFHDPDIPIRCVNRVEKNRDFILTIVPTDHVSFVSRYNDNRNELSLNKIVKCTSYNIKYVNSVSSAFFIQE